MPDRSVETTLSLTSLSASTHMYFTLLRLRLPMDTPPSAFASTVNVAVSPAFTVTSCGCLVKLTVTVLPLPLPPPIMSPIPLRSAAAIAPAGTRDTSIRAVISRLTMRFFIIFLLSAVFSAGRSCGRIKLIILFCHCNGKCQQPVILYIYGKGVSVHKASGRLIYMDYVSLGSGAFVHEYRRARLRSCRIHNRA